MTQRWTDGRSLPLCDHVVPGEWAFSLFFFFVELLFCFLVHLNSPHPPSLPLLSLDLETSLVGAGGGTAAVHNYYEPQERK